MVKNENITEQLKAENPMLRIQSMNNIRNRATKIVNNEIISKRNNGKEKTFKSPCRLLFMFTFMYFYKLEYLNSIQFYTNGIVAISSTGKVIFTSPRAS